jgi:hypothetical protein
MTKLNKQQVRDEIGEGLDAPVTQAERDAVRRWKILGGEL